jgi:hypothetical protein
LLLHLLLLEVSLDKQLGGLEDLGVEVLLVGQDLSEVHNFFVKEHSCNFAGVGAVNAFNS